MEGSAAEDLGAPESWEVADLEESVSRLMLSKPNDAPASASASASSSALASDSSLTDLGGLGEKDLEDVVGQVDQFLREALENPRERLSSKCFAILIKEAKGILLIGFLSGFSSMSLF